MSDEIVHLQGTDHTLAVDVAPGRGAEISGLQVYHEGRWTETLYRANDFSPTDGWRGRAPWLWPAVGRSSLMQPGDTKPRVGTWSTGGEEFDIPIHGFAMNCQWDVIRQGATSVTCGLTSDDQTRGWYPFDFVLILYVGLSGDSVECMFSVTADAKNVAPMIWSVGNHITFALPFCDESSWKECTLSHTGTEQYGLTEHGFISDERIDLGVTTGLSVEDRSLHNGVLGGFENGGWEATLSNPNAFDLTVRQECVVGPDEAMKGMLPEHYALVLWGSEDEQYLCPEPWAGLPNSLNSGEGVVSLHPGQKAAWKMTIAAARAS